MKMRKNASTCNKDIEKALMKDWITLSARKPYWQGGPWKAFSLLRTR